MSTRILGPIEALRVVVEQSHGPDVETLEVLSARDAYVAEAFEIAELPGRSRDAAQAIASWNGYALPPGFTGGRCRFKNRLLVEEERGTMGDFNANASDAETLPLAERVETGDIVPAGTERVVPVDRATVVGRQLIEITTAALPPVGEGLIPTGSTIKIEAGTHVTPRLQALLLTASIHELRARPSWEVGIGTIGAELVDAMALEGLSMTETGAGHEGTATSTTESGGVPGSVVGDITGSWLPESLRGLGLKPSLLGTTSDDPRDLHALLRKAERQKLRTVILAGGLGTGLADRVVETLRSQPFHIFFERLSLRPGGGFLFAKGLGFDLFVLDGKPLDAALGFDVIVAPALLAARDAPRHTWDWSSAPLEEHQREKARSERRDGILEPVENHWTACPVVHDTRSWRSQAEILSPLEVYENAPSGLAFWPGLPGQTGWEILSPTAESPTRCYHVTCRP